MEQNMDIDANPHQSECPYQRTDVFMQYSDKDKKWLNELQ